MLLMYNVEDALQELAASGDVSGFNVESLTGDKTLGAADVEYQRLAPNGAARIVYLSTASTMPEGKVFRVTNTGSSSNHLTISQGATPIIAVGNDEEREFYYDGSDWVEITKIVLSGRTIIADDNTITTEASGNLAATELNTALAELDGQDTTIQTALTNHIDDTVASAISNVADGNIVATNVQAAIDELDSQDTAITDDLDTINHLTGDVQGGAATEYYHFTNAQHTALVPVSTAIIAASDISVGIGVTPDAWLNTITALDMGSSTALIDYGKDTYILNNAYVNSSSDYIVKDTGEAAMYRQDDFGTHSFKVAASAFGGTEPTWIDALDIDNTGSSAFGVRCNRRYRYNWRLSCSWCVRPVWCYSG